jgi:hypothetical protein
MKWITRERVKADRVACPWLIRKYDLTRNPALVLLGRIVNGALYAYCQQRVRQGKPEGMFKTQG